MNTELTSLYDFVVIGGGVAGLSAANQLVDLKVNSILVIESGSYPTHKICGEFLSPECLATLKTWNIPKPTEISSISFNVLGARFDFNLSTSAGGLSHIYLDPILAERIQRNGINLLTNTQVVDIQPPSTTSNLFSIHLSNNKIIQARQLIVATGRLPQFQEKKLPPKYIGIKSHFEGIKLDCDMEMYSFPKTYIGLSKIEDEKVNIACLTREMDPDILTSPRLFIDKLCTQNAEFGRKINQGNMIFPKWMTSYAPAFGIKQPPSWNNAYFIGDAAAAIPPACGNGLSMGILSGCLAAQYALRQDPVGFKKEWNKRYQHTFFYGKVLNEAMLNPFFGAAFVKLCSQFPSVPKYFFRKTRDVS